MLILAQIPSFHSLRHINLVSLVLCLAYSACATAGSVSIGKYYSSESRHRLGFPAINCSNCFQFVQHIVREPTSAQIQCQVVSLVIWAVGSHVDFLTCVVQIVVNRIAQMGIHNNLSNYCDVRFHNTKYIHKQHGTNL